MHLFPDCILSDQTSIIQVSGRTAKYLNFHLRHAVRGEPFDFAQDRRVEP